MYSVLEQLTRSIHHLAGDSHHTASPMGLWMLLATASTATPRHSEARVKVESTLGMPVEQALSVLEELLGQDYPFTAISPYKVAQQFSKGEISHDSMISQLKHWPYIAVDDDGILDTEQESVLVDPPGTFWEVEEAVQDGLISEIDYVEISSYCPISKKMESNVGQMQASMAVWSRGNSSDELQSWIKTLKTDNLVPGIAGIAVEDTEVFYQWRNSLLAVERGSIPNQARFDQWLVAITDGSIENLSLDILDETFIILLSVIATKLTWKHPFAQHLNENLAHDFSHAKTMLVSSPGQDVFVTDTQYGEMAVHRARSNNGISVYSVIADPSVDYVDVISTAQQIAISYNGHNLAKPLHSLEVNGSSLYDILRTAEGEHSVAYLPLWKTSNTYEDLYLANDNNDNNDGNGNNVFMK